MLNLELKEIYIHFGKEVSSGVFTLSTDNLSDNKYVKTFIEGIEYAYKEYGESSVIGVDTVSNYKKALAEGKNNFNLNDKNSPTSTK